MQLSKHIGGGLGLLLDRFIVRRGEGTGAPAEVAATVVSGAVMRFSGEPAPVGLEPRPSDEASGLILLGNALPDEDGGDKDDAWCCCCCCCDDNGTSDNVPLKENAGGGDNEDSRFGGEVLLLLPLPGVCGRRVLAVPFSGLGLSPLLSTSELALPTAAAVFSAPPTKGGGGAPSLLSGVDSSSGAPLSLFSGDGVSGKSS